MWLTNRIGEISHGTPELLQSFGLDTGAWQGGWYPLTKREQAFLRGRETGFWMKSGFLATTNTTALYQDKKWIAVSVEYTTEEAWDSDVERAKLLRTMQDEVAVIRRAVELAGGVLFLHEDEFEDGHALHILFLMDWAMAEFDNSNFLSEWICELVGGTTWETK